LPGDTLGFPQYVVQVHNFSLKSNDDTTLYTGPENVAGIGRLFAIHPQTLVFSQIPNLEDWIDAIAAGRFDPSLPEDSSALQLETVPVSVLALDLATSELTTIVTHVSLFTPRLAS
jgi:hypothetical protein